MAYRQCSHCDAVTDENEPKCSSCGKNPLNNGIITLEDLISRIKKGEIPLSKIWTKNPSKIYHAWQGFPL